MRLLGAAKRVERVGSDACAVLGPGVVPSQNLVVSGEGKSERFRWETPYQKAKQIAARNVGVWVVGAERLLVDRHRALKERPCPRKVALVRLAAVSKCSGPNACSRIASARS